MLNPYIDRLKTDELPKGLDWCWDRLAGFANNRLPRQWNNLSFAKKVHAQRDEIARLDDKQLKEKLQKFRGLTICDRLKGKDLIRALSCICEAAQRTKKMYPYPVQIAGVMSMLQGCIAEMATGEGKTLTAALAAILLGWRGKGCHVLTSNNYLAERDAEEFKILFEFCGLSVSAIKTDSQGEERRDSYWADVTYCTNQDVAADFLRDQILLGRKQSSSRLLLNKIVSHSGMDNSTPELMLRGLEYAVVDEADSVMIDDGITPLLISSESQDDEEKEIYKQALTYLKALDKSSYKLDYNFREVALTEKGKQSLHKALELAPGIWQQKLRSEEIILQALKAKYFFECDKQYIIDDAKVVIVDEATGRTMPDRFWSNGIHQSVEAKEGLDISPPKHTSARISFQKFFRLYQFRCGMTGTASEAEREFWHFFKMPIVRIPTHKKCLRRFNSTKIFINEKKKWQAVANAVTTQSKKGRPVLIGTASIKGSEALSSILQSQKTEHTILNARHHKDEVDIISRAGNSARVTVATNMAGRGTDIKLDPQARSAGGLTVIATERFHSSRVDRQLYGRCSRQGDPGEVFLFLSLEDELIINQGGIAAKLIKVLFPTIPAFLLGYFFTHLQNKSIKQSRRQRAAVLKSDDWLEQMLGFSGESF